MPFELPPLPYADDALMPHISAETLAYHYGKHHRAYVNNLNKLTEGTEWADTSLEDIICRADGAIFNNGAQVWNHSFYWSCMSPSGGGEPTGEVATRVNSSFGGFAEFRNRFTAEAAGRFGSGWAWLVSAPSGQLSIVSTSNAGNPLRDGEKPLLTCDVWEHAYYIDYRNARPEYLEHFWDLVNWDFVTENL
jgi:Fe-Mn family superoxide dismutase